MKKYAVLGLGRFGFTIAEELSKQGAEVIAIDTDEKKINAIIDKVTTAYTISNVITAEEMDQAGLSKCDVILVCIGTNLEASILNTLAVLELDGPKIYAKANSDYHGKVLEKIGASTIYPEKEMAIRYAKQLETNNVLDIIEENKDFSIAEFIITKRFSGKSIIDLNFRRIYNLNIIAIIRDGKFHVDFDPENVLNEGDKIIACANSEGLIKFSDDLKI